MRLSTYGPIYTSTFDGDSPEKRQPVADLYSHFASQCQEPFLEPMCGTGYFLIPYLQRGIDIEGMDASGDMLKLCREKAIQAEVSPVLYEQRIEELALPRRYGYIFIPDGSFAHVHEKEVATASLRRLHDHLLPDGLLALDVKQPPQERFDEGRWHGQRQVLADGSLIVSSMLYDYKDEGRVLHCAHKHERVVAGHIVETEVDEYIERYYDLDEFTVMLQTVGFEEIKVMKAVALDPEVNTIIWPNATDTMIFICRRTK